MEALKLMRRPVKKLIRLSRRQKRRISLTMVNRIVARFRMENRRMAVVNRKKKKRQERIRQLMGRRRLTTRLRKNKQERRTERLLAPQLILLKREKTRQIPQKKIRVRPIPRKRIRVQQRSHQVTKERRILRKREMARLISLKKMRRQMVIKTTNQQLIRHLRLMEATQKTMALKLLWSIQIPKTTQTKTKTVKEQ